MWALWGTSGVPKSAVQALDEVFSAQRRVLVRALVRMVGSVPVAEELVHEAYVRARAAVESRNVEYVQPFLYQTARNLALDHLRVQRRWAAVLAEGVKEDTLTEVAAETPSPERETQDGQLIAHLQSAVSALTWRQQQVLALAKLRGWTYGEIARHLGVSSSTVQKELKVAIAACVRAFAELDSR